MIQIDDNVLRQWRSHAEKSDDPLSERLIEVIDLALADHREILTMCGVMEGMNAALDSRDEVQIKISKELMLKALAPHRA